MLNLSAVSRAGLLILVTIGTTHIWTGVVTQLRDADVVPRRLALGLLRRPFQPTAAPQPTLLVGAIPDEIAASLFMPEGATVHGSAVYPGRFIVVATATVASDQLKEAYGQEMLQRGWEVPQPRGSLGSETRRAILVPLVYCNVDNDSVIVLIDMEGAESSSIRIELARDTPGSLCRPRPATPDLGDRLGINSIDLPESSPLASGRCMGNARTGTWIGGFSTELTGAQLLTHYTQQLESAGWTSTERIAAPESVTGAWTLNREGREVAHAVLAITGFPQREDCWSIDLAITGTSGERQDDP